MDYKDILTGVAERLSSLRGERLSAGTKYRLMGMAADIAEVAETLSAEVLERVRHEAVLDVDADTDFDQLAEEVLSWELTVAGDDLQELTQQVNSALGSLSDEVLAQVAAGRLHRRALPAVARHDAQAGHVYCRCVLRQVTDALEVEAVSGTVAHQQSGAGEVGDAGDGQVALTFGRN